jgi:chaperonin GroES
VNVHPFRACLFVSRIDEQETASTGIAVAEGTTAEGEEGKVLAVGNPRKGATDVAMPVKVGDKIRFGKNSGTEIHIDGKAVLVVRQDQVLAVLA